MSATATIISGASSGLGAEMARQLAARGHDLGLCARRRDRLEDLARELREQTGRRVFVEQVDVVDADAVNAAFHRFARALGRVDRVIVNAGSGRGAPIGTERSDVNRITAMTNFVGALSQFEAALEIFRAQGRGHLVAISSISALRGMRRSMTTYAATKAGIAALAEGIRAEQIPGVEVSVIYPGYIRSEMNDHVQQRTPFMVDTAEGVRAIIAAIDSKRERAYVPTWPWRPIGMAMKFAPDAAVRRLT
ncbi:SDR family oxidoreductase [Calidifontibacter sp. DB0510]|uniref:SDR family oxidoreductase n=1 Tax=Metallococcus carri TaxID=1656884 RepID=A0A967EBU4_9MICO|nr:SDR family oxidoreductase [Metallococcus carri]NHN57334.1 SDR family oxidoreductase [Metallococcus carri]NOP38061.1 SDR family oxidoreductase [Calidifontibacter sp. DB2511S]